jgi:glycosyltransferase involved in cell wall biosynthesis
MSIVSVIIPCYNQGEFLSDAVGSVLRQIYKEWEIVIVNDGSTDNTQECIENEIKKSPQKIRSITHESNKGLSAARNTAIKNAKGPFILPLDADDMIKSNFLSECVPLITRGLADIIYTDIEYFGSCKGIKKMPNYNFKNYVKRNQFCCSALYHKKHCVEVGGYDESFKYGYEDWEFGIRMGKAGHRGLRIPKALFLYRQRANSMLSTTRKHGIEIWKQIYLKHPELRKFR